MSAMRHIAAFFVYTNLADEGTHLWYRGCVYKFQKGRGKEKTTEMGATMKWNIVLVGGSRPEKAL